MKRRISIAEYRKIALIFCLGPVLFAFRGGLEADGKVAGFDLPKPDSAPLTVAIARDGSLWFTEQNGNAIGHMTRDGKLLNEYPLPHAGSAPRIIALGNSPDGKENVMWFSEHLGNRMGRIQVEGGDTGFIDEFPIPTPDSQPRAIALTSDGNIWFGEFKGGKIGRVTPAGKIDEFPIPTPGSGPRALAAGPDGAVWFSEFSASKIGRITKDGAITEFVLPRPNSGPGDITTGADGNLWFVELNGRVDGKQIDGNRVGRMTTKGVATEFEIPSKQGSPINIAVGPDRNIWYTKGPNILGRVTPAGTITEFAALGPMSRPTGLTAGADRQPPKHLTDRLYFTDGGTNQIGWMRFR